MEMATDDNINLPAKPMARATPLSDSAAACSRAAAELAGIKVLVYDRISPLIQFVEQRLSLSIIRLAISKQPK